MCGILAIIGGPLPVTESVADSALDLLQHRGPNDRGVWSTANAWLGHRRLSIIDTGSGGHQPMRHEESGIVVIFNGEIYNYIELRDELIKIGHRFHSHSDTEVLLVAFLEWGKECVRHFNGMWSFLIWDPRADEAFFSRDRFGVKPFYYALVRGRFSVASEPKALIALYPELRKVEKGTLGRFLDKGLLCDSECSFYEGIRILPPAHSGVFKPGCQTPQLDRYWDFPRHEDKLPDSAQLTQDFQDLFEDAVRLRLRSDVPVGITLSGGLDSTAILHASSHGQPDGHGGILAFTSTYKTASGESGPSESEWAWLAAKPYTRVDVVEVDAGSDWLPILRRVAWHMDSPGYSPAVFPLWKIMSAARQRKVPVLLEGQGADELLGGYTQYAALAFLNDLRTTLTGIGDKDIAQLLRDLRGYRSTFGTAPFLLWLGRMLFPPLNYMNRALFGAGGTLRKDFTQSVQTDLKRSDDPLQGSAMDRRLLNDFSRDILPGLLHYGDAVSMAHSIESRLPFMDYRLVEFGFRLPLSRKVGEGETKRILRGYLRNAGQHEIASRKKKVGYLTPVDQWLTANNSAVPREVLLSAGSHIHEYCDPNKIEQLINLHSKGHPRIGNHLFRLLTTELWLQECIFGVTDQTESKVNAVYSVSAYN